MQQRFIGDAVVAAPSGAKALDELHHFAAVLESVYAALDTCHRSISSLQQVRNLRRKALEIAGENGLVLAEIPLALARLLAQDMTAAAELVTVHDLAVCTHLHAFGGPPMGSDLRHDFSRRCVVFRLFRIRRFRREPLAPVIPRSLRTRRELPLPSRLGPRLLLPPPRPSWPRRRPPNL